MKTYNLFLYINPVSHNLILIHLLLLAAVL